MRTLAFRGVSLSVIAALMAPTGVAPAMAQGAERVVDGQPTPELCAQYGFGGPAVGYEVRGRPFAGAQNFAPPPPPPRPAPSPPVLQPREVSPNAAITAPPPLPLPPAKKKEQRIEQVPPAAPPSAAVDQVVVTGQFARAAPAQPYLYGAPEKYPDATTNPIKQAASEPVSTFSIDVDTASYSNVRRFLADGQRPPADAVRVEELVNYFDYGYPAPRSRETPFSTFVAVAPSPWAKGKELIHIGVQGFRPAEGSQPPLNLVFLVDTSGSMFSDDRLPLAKKALNVLIDQLRPQDRVSLVAYAGSAGAVLQPTSGTEKLKIRCAVDYLQSGGSTAGGAGLSLAYALAEQHFDKQDVNRIVLMTDGDFNVGVTDNKRLEDYVAEKKKSGVYLSLYGFGRGNYQDARMQAIAQHGNGTAAYVDGLDEARKIFRDDFSKAMFPIADDVKIQVEFNPARVAEYRLIGYETRMLKREDFNNDAVDAGEVNAGASVTALYEITPVGGPRSVDPLRYGAPEPKVPGGGELAFLKIRYKPPGGQVSRLIERPIGGDSGFASLDRAPEATRWAAAVAAYGQKLRNDPYLAPDFTWEQVLNLAQGARGQDPTGIRAQFVALARSAEEVQGKTVLGSR
ncbi:MAG TPA: von Willebrand factor type A domain-containing protein [Caulobacteraceae bacterium]|nr:von Willebrand factor type A domain-containing protein [Caulobacteraceae bacterium]